MWIFKIDACGCPQALCRSCGKPIEWAITTNGKTIPLEAGFATLERKTFKVESGAMVTIIKVSEKASHFVTCPQANQWRKK